MEKLNKFLLYAKEKEAFRVKLQRNLLSVTESIDSYTELKINEFIANAIEKHSGIYLYDNVTKANNLSAKIEVICPIHGNFSVHRKDHLNGSGCPQCKQENINIANILAPEDVYGNIEVNKQQLEHIRVNLINFLMGKDILSLEKLIGKSDDTTWTKKSSKEEYATINKCPIHGIYSIAGATGGQYHCIKCAAEDLVGIQVPEEERKKVITAQKTLYLAQTYDKELYKIGVTSNIDRRLRELRLVTLVCSCTTDNAYKHEAILHKKYKDQNCYFKKAVGRGATEYFRLTPEQVEDIRKYIEGRASTNC